MDWNIAGSILLNIVLLVPIAGITFLAVDTYKHMTSEAN